VSIKKVIGKDPVFIDMKFTGFHQGTTPISLGMVDSPGNRFYTEFNDYDRSQVGPWLTNHVIPKFKFKKHSDNRMTYSIEREIVIEGGVRHQARVLHRLRQEGVEKKVREWFSLRGEVAVVSDVLAYDWVLFCEIFGGAFHAPKNVYYIPFDIATMMACKGVTQTSRGRLSPGSGIRRTGPRSKGITPCGTP